MATYSTTMCSASASAPTTSELVAHCQVCGVQWQVSQGKADTKGCGFCGAPKEAIVVVSEAPGYGGAVVYDSD